MPSTYSDLKIELINTGSQAGTWGATTNTNLGTALEEAITGIASPEFASDANLTINYLDSNVSQDFRNLVLNVVSLIPLTATRELIVPTIEKQYLVWNNTTGSQSITVKTGAGTGVTVPNGAKVHVFVDGTNVVEAVNRLNQTNIPQNKVLVDTDSSQTLTNKTISADNNTLSGIAASSFVLSNASGNIDGSAAQKVIPAGVVVGTTDTQTLTNKTINLSSNTLQATSAQIAAAVTDETGTGNLVFSTSPTLVTPTLGAASATSVSFGAGTVTAPSITTTGDTNTGIYFPAADTIGFTEGGAERMRIDSAGNVGIGTTSPSAPLHVAGTNSIIIPVGTTAQRAGTPVTGMVRYNTSEQRLELYNGFVWSQLGIDVPFLPLGSPMGGGFFGGFISTNEDGVPTHALIVAPKATGENLSIAYGPTGRSDPTSFIDGPANTATLVATGDAPAAQFCAGLTIGGFTDWYMPARSELNVLYWSLKPTTTLNTTSNPDRLRNDFSVPKITTNVAPEGPPVQTIANQFRDGDSEQFVADGYWSSSQGGTNIAWRQFFDIGRVGTSTKTGLRRVRAVRRIAI